MPYVVAEGQTQSGRVVWTWAPADRGVTGETWRKGEKGRESPRVAEPDQSQPQKGRVWPLGGYVEAGLRPGGQRTGHR